jgi:hypothetical protein
MKPLVVFFMTFCLHVNIACGETTFDVRSDCRLFADLWFRPEKSSDWNAPTRLTPNHGRKEVVLKSGVNHFLVVMDKSRNEDRLGWFNFDEIVKPYADKDLIPTILLSCLYVWETRTRKVVVERTRPEERTRTYNVTRSVPEARTKIVRVWDRRQRRWVTEERTSTVWRSVTEQREATYTVDVPYTEEVEQKYRVRVRKPVLKVISDGRARVIQPISRESR